MDVHVCKSACIRDLFYRLATVPNRSSKPKGVNYELDQILKGLIFLHFFFLLKDLIFFFSRLQKNCLSRIRFKVRAFNTFYIAFHMILLLF